MSKASGGESKNTLYCSFCGKSQHEVRKLIAGPTVFICDECVELCMEIIREENKTSFMKSKEGVPAPQEIVKLKRRLNEIYAKHTGQTVEAIEKMLDRDTYMTAEEAKNFGLLDKVMVRRPENEAPV